MNIRLHIERLVLDGLPLSQRQGAQVRSAVENELAGLLCSGVFDAQFAAGGAVPAAQGAAIHGAKAANAAGLGRQIAGSVVSAIGGRR